MENIQSKIELILFNYIVSDEGIIDDEGLYNVPLEYDNNIRYTYSDTNDIGERSIIEQKKLKFLNEVMDILSDIHLYIHQTDPLNKPMYFIPEQIVEQKLIKDEAPLDHEPELDNKDNEVEILNDTIEAMAI